MLEQNFLPPNKPRAKTACHRKKITSPIVNAMKNFQMAKKLHRENLEHDPLPDTVTHSMFRKLQMQRDGKEPGLALNDENYATGIGWKGYPGYGPTKCTKLKVYRPKTSMPLKQQDKNDGRPNSVTSFDQKWRFLRKRKVTPMELAICWDLVPENPTDEPKRTPHIDGSNGSLAPAVFSLVHTPKEEEITIFEEKSVPVFQKLPPRSKFDADFILDRPKTSKLIRQASVDSDSTEKSLKRAKSAYNLHSTLEEEICIKCDNIHQSVPNLADCGGHLTKHFKNRLCMACEIKKLSVKDKQKPKNEFKMAFKAGVPQKCKDKREDYPEHWRLASVYQHSYKPIQARKRPLLATVYK